MNLILFGPPGAGKGTQSHLLKTQKNLVHLSTGDLFRKHLKDNTELGQKVKSFITKGDLVPDDTTAELIEEEIKKNLKKSFILDGYPRNLNQSIILEKMEKRLNFSFDKAFFIEISKEVLVERLSLRRSCQDCDKLYHLKFKAPQNPGKCDICKKELYHREDDKVEVIEKRLEIYEKNTKDLKEFYKNKSILELLDGNQPPEAVFQEICEKLKI